MTEKQLIRNRSGQVQLDYFNRPLYVGQPVLILNATYCKGGRSSISQGVVIGFNRHCIVLDGEPDQADIEHYQRFLHDKVHNKDWKYDWQELDERGLKNVRTDTVTSCYLIGCTESTIRGWADGTLFTDS